MLRLRADAAPRLFKHFRLPAAFLLFSLAAFVARGDEPLKVGAITIESLNVFSPAEAARGWLYRAADAVHIVTRTSVIRKFLLFRTGDPYDPAILAETERNLRGLGFIKFASVLPGKPHDGVVDVAVVTQDAWTTEPGVSFGRRGGVTTYGFELTEKDFLGSGRQIAFSYDKGTERTDRLFEYNDPYIFGPYWKGDLIYGKNSDGEQARAEVSRPFYSYLSTWATSAIFDRVRQNDRLYADGEISERFQQTHREILASYGKAIEATERRARRVTAGYREVQDDFAVLPDRPADLLPDPRHFRYLFLQYEDAGSNFLKLNYVNRDVRYEDFNLAPRVLLRAAVSPSFFGVRRTSGFARGEFQDGWRLAEESFLQAALSYEARWESGVKNGILTGVVRYVHKFGTPLLQTLVSRLEYDQGWHLDREFQLFADGSTGLRAYRLHAFDGDRTLVWNIEHRIFSGREILQLFSPGLAIFFDTGAAELPGRPLKISSFKSDIGVGLRIGISRASTNNTLRIDAAYALNADPSGRRGWQISFSSGQAF